MRAVYFCLPITIIINQKQRLLVSPIQLVQILQIVEELVSSFYLWPFLPEANIRQAELQLSL